MDNLFGKIKGVQAYQDDILIFADSLEEHNKVLRQVLSVLIDTGLTIRRDKCKFATQELEYLGHTISATGIKLRFCIIKAIRDATPKDRDALRSFLGLTEYCACFVQGYAKLVEPLCNLMRKGVNFEWTEDLSETFEKLKKVIEESSALHVFKSRSKCVITVDARLIGSGAVLSQWVSGREQTVAFASRRFGDPLQHN